MFDYNMGSKQLSTLKLAYEDSVSLPLADSEPASFFSWVLCLGAAETPFAM